MASDEINWFNPVNAWDESGYEMIGVLFGLAVYNSILLDVPEVPGTTSTVARLVTRLARLANNETQRRQAPKFDSSAGNIIRLVEISNGFALAN